MEVAQPFALPGAIGYFARAQRVGSTPSERLNARTTARDPLPARTGRTGAPPARAEIPPAPARGPARSGYRIHERDGDCAAAQAGGLGVVRREPPEIQADLEENARNTLTQPQTPFQVMDVGAALLEGRVVADFLVQRHIGFDAFDHHLRERVLHARDGGLARVAVGDDLADERVVVRRHVVAAVDVAVDPDAGAARRMPAADGAGGGHELRGSSALMRHSKAWPRNWMSFWRRAGAAAIRSCPFTMSMPVMNSVTGCSTCMRVFISMK